MAAAAMNADMDDPEFVNVNLEDDDLMTMDEDADPEPSPVPAPRLRSTIAGGGDADDGPRKTKGRGLRADPRYSSAPRDTGRPDFDSLATDGGRSPVRSIEGWIVLVTGVDEEAVEDEVYNAFREYGQVKNLHLNLDRRTGFVKGYALIEYENFEEAQAAIKELDGSLLYKQIINVDWAFSNGAVKRRNPRKRSPRGHRSRSPPRRRY